MAGEDPPGVGDSTTDPIAGGYAKGRPKNSRWRSKSLREYRETEPAYRVSDADKYGSRGTEEIIRTQERLVRAGLLRKNDYTPGFWGRSSRDAFQELLEVANAEGSSWQSTLSRWEKEGKPEAGEARQGRTFVISTPDPARLRKENDDLAQSLLGRRLSEAEREQYVRDAIIQDKAQQERRVASEKATGEPGAADQTLYETDIDPIARMEEDIKRRYAGEYGAHEIANAGASFFEMLGGA